MLRDVPVLMYAFMAWTGHLYRTLLRYPATVFDLDRLKLSCYTKTSESWMAVREALKSSSGLLFHGFPQPRNLCRSGQKRFLLAKVSRGCCCKRTW